MDPSSSDRETVSPVLRRRSIRFLIVGAWNTVFGYGVFFVLDTVFSRLLSPAYVAYMSAMIISQVIAILNAYIFHKRITFRSAARGWGMVVEFFRFSATYALTFLLSLFLLPVLVEVFNIIPKVAGLIITVICTGISYIGHSRFTFRAKTS